MKVGYLNDGDFGRNAKIDLVIGRDKVVVLIKADDADDYLHDHQDGNYEELCLQRFMVEESHAQEGADRASDPGPEEKGLLGYTALVLFRARLIVAVQDEGSEIN